MTVEESRTGRPNLIEFAWRVHAAQEAWTAKVDGKASVLLALDGGFILVVLSSQTWLIRGSEPWNWYRASGLIGLWLLVLAIMSAAISVAPITGTSAAHRAEHGNNFIYFGHTRLWQSTALATRMTELTFGDEILMVSRQIVAVSKLNWWKHRCLQICVWLTLVALLALALATTAPVLI